jgi:hypothetical protein
MTDLHESARLTKEDLVWQIGIQSALKQCRQAIKEKAAAALTWPADYPGLGALQRRWNQAGRQPRDHPDHMLAKGAVVYVVSLLEPFLADAYRDLYQKEPCSKWGAGKLLTEVVKKLPALEQEAEGYTKWVRLLIFLRNAIVHDRGVVTEQFRAQAGTLIKAVLAWQDNNLDSFYALGKQVDLHHDRIIFAGIESAILFVDRLLALAKKRGPSRAD